MSEQALAFLSALIAHDHFQICNSTFYTGLHRTKVKRGFKRGLRGVGLEVALAPHKINSVFFSLKLKKLNGIHTLMSLRHSNSDWMK